MNNAITYNTFLEKKMNNKYFFILLKKRIPIDIINIILLYFGKKGVGGNYIEKIDLPKICSYSKASLYVNLKNYRLSISIYERDDYLCYALSKKDDIYWVAMYVTDDGWHDEDEWLQLEWC